MCTAQASQFFEIGTVTIPVLQMIKLILSLSKVPKLVSGGAKV